MCSLKFKKKTTSGTNISPQNQKTGNKKNDDNEARKTYREASRNIVALWKSQRKKPGCLYEKFTMPLIWGQNIPRFTVVELRKAWNKKTPGSDEVSALLENVTRTSLISIRIFSRNTKKATIYATPQKLFMLRSCCKLLKKKILNSLEAYLFCILALLRELDVRRFAKYEITKDEKLLGNEDFVALTLNP